MGLPGSQANLNLDYQYIWKYKHCSKTFSFENFDELSRYGLFIIGENPQKWHQLGVFFPWPSGPRNCFTNGCWKLTNGITENWWYFAFFTFCAVNQFTLQLGFDSIGNSRIGRKEILNTAIPETKERRLTEGCRKISRFTCFCRVLVFFHDHMFRPLNTTPDSGCSKQRRHAL